MAVHEAVGHADARTRSRKPATRLIDVDVHPTLAGGLDELFPYMPAGWRERLKDQKGGLRPTIAGRMPKNHSGGIKEARPPSGGPAGSDPDFLRQELLDRYSIDIALLILVEAATLAVAPTDADQSAVLVSACNDYFLERWVDDRMRWALAVSPADPQLAVQEIRRHGANPKVAAVYLPIPDIRLGNRHFYPIYEAALEYGLPIATHPGAGESQFQGTAARFAVGIQERYIERYCDWGQIGWSCITSLIMNGVFDRYPELKVLFIEWGFSWAVPLMWKMDKAWRSARMDVPWVRKWPREYVHDHIRFSTQPIDEPEDPKHLDWMIENYFTDTLMFATDYPHWDLDLPDMVMKTLPAQTREKIFHKTAEAALRL